jgi:hypothetical protein
VLHATHDHPILWRTVAEYISQALTAHDITLKNLPVIPMDQWFSLFACKQDSATAQDLQAVVSLVFLLDARGQYTNDMASLRSSYTHSLSILPTKMRRLGHPETRTLRLLALLASTCRRAVSQRSAFETKPRLCTTTCIAGSVTGRVAVFFRLEHEPRLRIPYIPIIVTSFSKL